MFTFHEGVTCSLIGAPHPPCLLQEQKPLSHARTNTKKSLCFRVAAGPASSKPPVATALAQGIANNFLFWGKSLSPLVRLRYPNKDHIECPKIPPGHTLLLEHFFETKKEQNNGYLHSKTTHIGPTKAPLCL
jgi:hypothetical protein